MNNDELRLALFGKSKPVEKVIADRSVVQQYATCPFAAWACKEYGIDETNVLRDVGNEAHKLAEECIKTGIEDQVLPEDMADWFINELPKVRPDIQPQVIRAVKYLAESITHLQPHRILGVETQIDCASGIYAKTGHQFVLTACLDLLLGGTNSLIVFDWKSGYKKRTNQETYDDFQCQFDVFILFKMYPEIDTIHWFYDETFWGTKSYARFERNASTIHPELTTEMQFQGRIFSALNLWKDDCREAWPEEKKCCWCDAIFFCPHASAGSKKIASNPRRFIDRMVALQAILDRYNKIAKDWYKRYGQLAGSEMVYEWRKPKQNFTPRLYKSHE